MDETLGPNKCFKDISYGLASQGISSIRYNKRSYDYQNLMAKNANDITIDKEVTNDAISAVKLAKKLGYEKVILVGHSLGGHMAPKIASKSKVDGVIVLAGVSSSFVDVIVPQYVYLMENDSTSGITEFQLNMIRQQVKNVKENNYTEETVGFSLPFSLSGKYWHSLDSYDPIKIANKQKIPYLILNGDRDYQVDTVQAKNWNNGTKNPDSKTIIYPGLNHLFYFGEGVLLPAEYERKSHVEELVIMDISKWVKSF